MGWWLFFSEYREKLSASVRKQRGEGAGEQANQEGGGAADDVNHGGGKDRNEGVLPGEGVEQGHHSMGAAGQGAGRQTETELLSPGPAPSGNGS